MAISVGTCSWTDKTLIACKRFYPRGCSSAEARLRFYAGTFPLVEVDSSYYAMPSVDNSLRWVERTPEGFVFNIKAFRLLTNHPTQLAMLPRDLQAAWSPAKARFYYRDVPGEIQDELWRRFREAIAPLKDAGKLRLVHFQFPPWVRPDRSGIEHLRHCVERMQGHVVSVEFRHGSWFDERRTASTLALERELGVVHTIVDGPQGFDNSLPQVWEATHPGYAYLRLHGRNTETWDIAGATVASDRFNYDYPDAELGELAHKLLAFTGIGLQTHVVFNNNLEDQGQRNALSLMRMIRARDLAGRLVEPARHL